MQQVRRHLTYANVMSSVAVFLIVAGGAAFAAHKIAKHSVGTRQLKANAVTTAKLKRNAVTTRKIAKNAVTSAKLREGAISTLKLARGAVTGEKIAPNTITGENINAPTTPFTQVVARLRTSAVLPFSAAEPLYPIGTYTQAPGEDDQYLAGMDVTFSVSCESPRSAVVLLLSDVTSLKEFSSEKLLGIGFAEDEGSGAVSRRVEFAPFLEGGVMSRLAPSVATARHISAFLANEECKAGGGVSATAGLVDVLGTK